MNDDAKRSPSGSPLRALTEHERRSHEVRTQLTVIGLRAQLLRRHLRALALEAPELVRSLDVIEGAVMKLHREVRRWEAPGADPDRPRPG